MQLTALSRRQLPILTEERMVFTSSMEMGLASTHMSLILVSIHSIKIFSLDSTTERTRLPTAFNMRTVSPERYRHGITGTHVVRVCLTPTTTTVTDMAHTWQESLVATPT